MSPDKFFKFYAYYITSYGYSLDKLIAPTCSSLKQQLLISISQTCVSSDFSLSSFVLVISSDSALSCLSITVTSLMTSCGEAINLICVSLEIIPLSFNGVSKRVSTVADPIFFVTYRTENGDHNTNQYLSH